jgi:hypothetical protein
MSDKYFVFLEKKITEGTKSDFFKSMFERLQKGYTLTPNMLNALDGAIEREKRNNNPIKERKHLVMTKWYAEKQGFASMVLNVEIEVETMKGYKVRGFSDIMKGTKCMKCGKKLKQPASYTLGYGPECAKKIGLAYPSALNSMSEEDSKEYQEKLFGKVRDQKFDGWIPKSQIEDVLDIVEDEAV